MRAVLALAIPAAAAALSWSLGPEKIIAHPVPGLQFPDAAFPLLPSINGSGAEMFYQVFRMNGPPVAPFPFPLSDPVPSTPVIGKGPFNTYDANGNWMLAVHRVGGANSSTLVGFTHAENHHFNCSDKYAEWNSGAVILSEDDGVTWSRLGTGVYDPQPCEPIFGGVSFSSVVPNMQTGVGFLGWDGCHGFKSDDEMGRPGTWFRYFNGSYSQPGNGGSMTCLPGLPGGDGGVAMSIVHWNSGLGEYVMLYQLWGQWLRILLSTSGDGVTWSPAVVVANITSYAEIAYPQVIGATSSSVAGLKATLVYAGNPPKSASPRDFVARSIQFFP